MSTGIAKGCAITKAKRVVFRVSWHAGLREWTVKEAGQRNCFAWRKKSEAVRYGVTIATSLHATGIRTQLVIHTKDGRIESERTYGADPVRRKG